MEVTIEKMSHRRLSLPVEGFRTARGTPGRRPVALVWLVCTIGGRRVVGRGEAAPLEAWGTESVEQVDDLLAGMQLPAGPVAVRRLDRLDPVLADAPATRHALETALLDATARRRELPLAALLAESPADETVAVNASVGAEADRRRIRQSLAGGVGCLKLKLDDTDPDAATERVVSVREMVPAGIGLRVDANGNWDRRVARDFLAGVAGMGIEYVEQPVSADDPEGLGALARASSTPIAADESAHPGSRARRILDRDVPVLVLKPAALGGLVPAVAIAERAAREGVRVVWSSAIESAIGRAALLHLAAVRGDGPHGLATGRLLGADVTSEFPAIREGALAVPDGTGIGIGVEPEALSALTDETRDRPEGDR